MRITKNPTDRENNKDPYLECERLRHLPSNERNEDPYRQREQQRPLTAMRTTRTPSDRENNKDPLPAIRTTRTPNCNENNKDPYLQWEQQRPRQRCPDSAHWHSLAWYSSTTNGDFIICTYVGSVSVHHKEQKECVLFKVIPQKHENITFLLQKKDKQ